MQPLEVVRNTDQIPFSRDPLKAPEKELPKPHGRLDDAKDRLHRAFPLGIDRFSGKCFQPMLHRLYRICGFGQGFRLAKPLFGRQVVLLPLNGNIGDNAFLK